MEHEVPLVAETQNAQHAIVGQIAAKLLGHADADMLDDLFGLAHMRRKLGHSFQDEMQVADRDPLGQQQLEHRLKARIGHMRRADFVRQLLVFRIEPIDEDLDVFVGQKLRQVVADDFAEMGQHHGDIVDRVETFALQFFHEGFEDRHSRHAEGGFADIVPGDRRLAAAAGDDQNFADAQLVRRDRRAVNADLVALVGDGDIVADLDFGHDEAVLAGEFLAHLADAEGQLLMSAEEPRRNLLAEKQFDFGGLQHVLHRVALGFLDLARLLLFGLAKRAILGLDLARDEPAAEGHGAGEDGEGDEGQPGHDGQHGHQAGRDRQSPG